MCASLFQSSLFISPTPIPVLPSAVGLLWFGWGSRTIYLRHLPQKGHTRQPHDEGKLTGKTLVPGPDALGKSCQSGLAFSSLDLGGQHPSAS